MSPKNKELLSEIVDLSQDYGRQNAWCIAGGGNSSLKNAQWIWVKPSGVPMATIRADQFVKMSRAQLEIIWQQDYPRERGAREGRAKDDLMAARAAGEEAKRPSVETLMHALLPQQIVFHSHPTLVNGLTCARDGERIARELFGDGLLWIPVVDPGYLLAVDIRERLERYRAARSGEFPDMILLQNHGLLVYGEDASSIRATHAAIVEILEGDLRRQSADQQALAAALRTSLPKELPKELAEELEVPARHAATLLQDLGYHHSRVEAAVEPLLSGFLADREAFRPLEGALSPDHIVYMGHQPLWIETAADLEDSIGAYCRQEGVAPRVIALRGLGIITAGVSPGMAESAQLLFHDAMQITGYASGYGGVQFLPPDQIDFIRNWEVEKYRAQVGAARETDAGGKG